MEQYKERPILFSGVMVRAILDGRKTQTRRPLKMQPPAATTSVRVFHHPDPRAHFWANDGASLLDWACPCPYGELGDRLWVRETHRAVYPQDPDYNGGDPIEYDYRATYTHGFRLGDSLGIKNPWTPSIHMPRAASRITLEITDVRVERLQDISNDDAIAEGINLHPDHHHRPDDSLYGPVQTYRDLWEQINGSGSWDANPWVWVVWFKRA